MHSLFFNTVDFLQNALPKAIPKTMGDVCNDIKKKIKQIISAGGLYFVNTTLSTQY